MNLVTEIKPIGPTLRKWSILCVIGLIIGFAALCHFIGFISKWSEKKLNQAEDWIMARS